MGHSPGPLFRDRMGLNLHVNRLDDLDAYDEIKLLQVKNFRFKSEEVKCSTNQIQLIEFWKGFDPYIGKVFSKTVKIGSSF
jgi:hypothetical protein